MFELQVDLAHILLLKLACKYFAVKLEITDEEYSLVNINSAKRLGGTGGNCSGSYRLDGTLHSINIKILNHASDIGMIDVIAHEMVHAKQHLRGEFTFEQRDSKFLWFKTKKIVKVHKGQVLEETPYFERLCEQEAFSKSRELTRQFLNFVYHLENQTDSNII